jgi:hypothetical protein
MRSTEFGTGEGAMQTRIVVAVISALLVFHVHDARRARAADVQGNWMLRIAGNDPVGLEIERIDVIPCVKLDLIVTHQAKPTQEEPEPGDQNPPEPTPESESVQQVETENETPPSDMIDGAGFVSPYGWVVWWDEAGRHFWGCFDHQRDQIDGWTCEGTFTATRAPAETETGPEPPETMGEPELVKQQSETQSAPVEPAAETEQADTQPSESDGEVRRRGSFLRRLRRGR